MGEVDAKSKHGKSHDDVGCLHHPIVLHIFFIVHTMEHCYVHKQVDRRQNRHVERNVTVNENHNEKGNRRVLAAYELTYLPSHCY